MYVVEKIYNVPHFCFLSYTALS